MADPLDDPTVVRALELIGSRIPAGRHLCPRCTTRWIRDDVDLCPPCAAEAREIELAYKRDYARRKRPRNATPLDAARAWLRWQLRKGPVRSTTIKGRADADGIAERTLQRAREVLDIEVTRDAAGTWWGLPAPDARANGASVGTNVRDQRTPPEGGR